MTIVQRARRPFFSHSAVTDAMIRREFVGDLLVSKFLPTTQGSKASKGQASCSPSMAHSGIQRFLFRELALVALPYGSCTDARLRTPARRMSFSHFPFTSSLSASFPPGPFVCVFPLPPRYVGTTKSYSFLGVRLLNT